MSPLPPLPPTFCPSPSLPQLLSWSLHWHLLYSLRRSPLAWEDASYLTRSAMRIPLPRWQAMGEMRGGERALRSDGGGRGPRGWVSCLGLGMRALQCGVLECHCPGRIGGSPSKGQRGGVDGGRGSWLICVDRYVQSHTMARSNDLLSTLLSSLPPFHPSPSHCTSSCSRHVASVAEQMTTTEPLWLNDDCGRKQTWSLTGKRCSSREQGGGGDDCRGGYGNSLFLCTV